MDPRRNTPARAPALGGTGPAPAPGAVRKAAKVAGVGLLFALVLGGLLVLGIGALVLDVLWTTLHTGFCNPRC